MNLRPRILAAVTLCCLTCGSGVLAAGHDYAVRPVPFTAVQFQDSFWRPRLETNARVTVPYCFERCEETGRIENFVAAAEKNPQKFRGLHYNDSDVFKILEGACYTLAVQPNPSLRRYVDDLVKKIAAAQEPDGYLYTMKTARFAQSYGALPRWSRLGGSHELYNVGHLYEAAVAHFHVTGDRTLLDVAIRNADLVCREFGPGEQQRKDVPGHEEIELGLVKLYRATGDRKYLEQAKFFVDMRGNDQRRNSLYGPYAQDHLPVARQTEAVGHAVRGGYFYAAVADIAALTGDQDYIQAIDRIWQDVVDKKLYLIGSVGQHGAGEGYAGAYKLSNLKAYNETCASVALMLWNHRMFLLHEHAKYIDVLERTMYNGLLAGVSQSGDRFFYPNPLECDLVFPFNHGSFERSPWFGTSCCPSNIARVIPSLPGYVYATKEDSLFVNLFVAGTAHATVADSKIRIDQDTNYPWDGHIRITVRPEKPTSFRLKIRIPGWAQGEVLPSKLYRYLDKHQAAWTIGVNGKQLDASLENGYATIDRTWQAGDAVTLHLSMPVRRVVADDRVTPDRGLVAIERGPLVYCAEGVDHDGHVRGLWLPDEELLQSQFDPDLLGGIVTVRGQARLISRSDNGALQRSPKRLTLIPYYAWCHRGANEMRVWLPRTEARADVPPPPTIASRARPSASHCWRGDTLRALNDQVEPFNSKDQDIARFTWWDHRGTTEWIQYEFDTPQRIHGIDIYWFDDAGSGFCRLPQECRVLYLDGKEWKPVQLTHADAIQRDRFNRYRFEVVKTRAIRVEVKLRRAFSGGVLEWKVLGAD